jgi:crotonobetainyl-CoA:carnitine CoA-transferase CaiB-like acyl-CoA transferase
MAGYDFLQGLRVVEVAQLGPSALGGLLADMGAEVVKIEGLDGEPVRQASEPAVGGPDGPSFLHLRWNRGKKSVGLDLKRPGGVQLFRDLVAKADVVIEGMRAGVLDRLGLDPETLRSLNPRLVFCSVSGLGRSGPYQALGSQGPSFDAFGALAAISPTARSPEERAAAPWVPVGMYAMGLYGALGVLSAVVRAQRTGVGAVVEVTGAEAAAHWLPEGVNQALNRPLLHPRPGFANADGRMAGWPRLYPYRTKDGRQVLFQGFYPKFWERFCHFVDRPDLLEGPRPGEDPAAADLRLHDALEQVFLTRTADQWMAAFLEHDIAGAPVNTLETLATDPHFLARDNVYQVDHPGIGPLRLTGTPVKTPGQPFAPTPAPRQWEHTAAVLHDWLGLDAAALATLQQARAVYLPDPPDLPDTPHPPEGRAG